MVCTIAVNIMKRIISLYLFLLLCIPVVSYAKLKMPGILGDNMVLQRNSSVMIWGHSSCGGNISVNASWSDKSIESQCDSDGNWDIVLNTPDAGGPFTIIVRDNDSSIIFENIMTGEVWLCSGQSNMEMPMKGYPNQPVDDAIDCIVEADTSIPIRIFNVNRKTSLKPEYDCTSSWQTNNPETVAQTSAVAYFFAKKLYSTLKVPVGIIIASWGGTPIESWVNKNTLEKFPLYDLSFLDTGILPNRPHYCPTTLYNGMLSPIVGYGIKGFLWYQGEANRNRPDNYRKVQAAFAGMLRDLWHNPEMPFYYVQIAPYNYEDPDGLSAAKFREGQMKNIEEIGNAGMAVTLDIGDANCIHPAQKEEVGNRLAYMALYNEYGYTAIDPFPPIYDSYEIRNGCIRVKFKVGPQGLAPYGVPLVEGFEIAGKDRKFYPATAVIIRENGGNTIDVRSEEVKKPVAVRYGFKNVSKASLYNCFGIPASPFRTDNWPD